MRRKIITEEGLGRFHIKLIALLQGKFDEIVEAMDGLWNQFQIALAKAAAGILAGEVTDYADLALLGLGPGDAGKGYYVRANGKLYTWDGQDFPGESGGIPLQGPGGPQGLTGGQGPAGVAGVTFSPLVDGDCNLTWTNDGGLLNPPAVNIRGLQGVPGDVGDKSGPVSFAPTGWPAGCMTFFRIGNSVQCTIDTGATVVPATVSANAIPAGYRPARALYFFCGMSGNGKPSFMCVNPDGTVQGGQQNAAAVIWAQTWVTEDAHPGQ